MFWVWWSYNAALHNSSSDIIHIVTKVVQQLVLRCLCRWLGLVVEGERVVDKSVMELVVAIRRHLAMFEMMGRATYNYKSHYYNLVSLCTPNMTWRGEWTYMTFRQTIFQVCSYLRTPCFLTTKLEPQIPQMPCRMSTLDRFSPIPIASYHPINLFRVNIAAIGIVVAKVAVRSPVLSLSTGVW